MASFAMNRDVRTHGDLTLVFASGAGRSLNLIQITEISAVMIAGNNIIFNSEGEIDMQIDSKHSDVIVIAYMECEKIFAAWKDPYSERIVAFELINANFPPITIMYFDTLDDFVDEMHWSDHLLAGIKCQELREKVNILLGE